MQDLAYKEASVSEHHAAIPALKDRACAAEVWVNRANEQVSPVSPFAALVLAEDPQQPHEPGQGDEPSADGPAAVEP